MYQNYWNTVSVILIKNLKGLVRMQRKELQVIDINGLLLNIRLSHKNFLHSFQMLLRKIIYYSYALGFHNLQYLKNKLLQLMKNISKLPKKSKPKLPVLPCSPQNPLLPLLCHRPICAHMKERQRKKGLVQLIKQNFQNKEKENFHH